MNGGPATVFGPRAFAAFREFATGPVSGEWGVTVHRPGQEPA